MFVVQCDRCYRFIEHKRFEKFCPYCKTRLPNDYRAVQEEAPQVEGGRVCSVRQTAREAPDPSSEET
jgi:Zn finger protein HypA/HybF involved in hydrogenase expression